MTGLKRYKTKLVQPQKGWLFLFLPNDLLGVKKRVWVKGTFNGKPFIGTANPWKNDQHVITINKVMRKQLGIVGDEEIDVELAFTVSETPPQDLEIPEPDTDNVIS